MRDSTGYLMMGNAFMIATFFSKELLVAGILGILTIIYWYLSVRRMEDEF